MILTCSGVSDDMFGGVKRNLGMGEARRQAFYPTVPRSENCRDDDQ